MNPVESANSNSRPRPSTSALGGVTEAGKDEEGGTSARSDEEHAKEREALEARRQLLEVHRDQAKMCFEQLNPTQWSFMTDLLRSEINRGNWHQLRGTTDPSTLVALVMHFMHTIDRGSLFPSTDHAQYLLDTLQYVLDKNSEGHMAKDKEDKVENPVMFERADGGDDQDIVDLRVDRDFSDPSSGLVNNISNVEVNNFATHQNLGGPH